MKNKKIVLLKSDKEHLNKKQKSIKKIKYPYILTKKTFENDFLACTMRQCFAKDKKLENIIKIIDSSIRK